MKTPHVCPVCGGNGLVLNGFYDQYGGNWPTSSATPEMCRTCNGKGIVWEPETNIEIDYTQEEE